MTDLASRLMTISTELNAIKREHPELAEWCGDAWSCIQEMEIAARLGERVVETSPGMNRVRSDLAKFNKDNPTQWRA